MSMFARVAAVAASVSSAAAAPEQGPDPRDALTATALVSFEPQQRELPAAPARDVLEMGSAGQGRAELGRAPHGAGGAVRYFTDPATGADPTTAPASQPTSQPATAPAFTPAKEVSQLQNMSVDDLRAQERYLDRKSEELTIKQNVGVDQASALTRVDQMLKSPKGLTHDAVIAELDRLATGVEANNATAAARNADQIAQLSAKLVNDTTKKEIEDAQAIIRRALKPLKLSADEMSFRLEPPAEVLSSADTIRDNTGSIASTRGKVDPTLTPLATALDDARVDKDPEGTRARKTSDVVNSLLAVTAQEGRVERGDKQIAELRQSILDKGKDLGLTAAELDAALERIGRSTAGRAQDEVGVSNLSEGDKMRAAAMRDLLKPAIDNWVKEATGSAAEERKQNAEDAKAAKEAERAEKKRQAEEEKRQRDLERGLRRGAKEIGGILKDLGR